MKEIVISVVVAVTLMLAAMFFTGQFSGGQANGVRGGDVAEQGSVENVSIENGKQIVEITAHGGYTPRLSIAKAGMPTIIRMKTAGTFDCSSSLSIASLGIHENLPSSGTKDIGVPVQQSGSSLSATCAMGMYNFEIQFK